MKNSLRGEVCWGETSAKEKKLGGAVEIKPAAQNLVRLPVTAPRVDSPKTIHFIQKVTDKGEPPLTRYKRVLVHVRP